MGFQSFFGNMSGMVAPAVTGYVLQRTGHFYWAFLIVAGVAFASATSWIFLVGRVEPVICKLNACRGPEVSREVA